MLIDFPIKGLFPLLLFIHIILHFYRLFKKDAVPVYFSDANLVLVMCITSVLE